MIANFARLTCWIGCSSLCVLLISQSKHSTSDYTLMAALIVLSAFAGEFVHRRLSH